MNKSRPVFESFDAFVRFINEAATAPMDFETFLSDNSSFFDANAMKGFDAVRIAATRAPLSYGTDGAQLKASSSNILGAFNATIKELIAGNKESSESKKVQNLRLAGKTTTEIKKFVYPALVNGKVVLTSDVAIFPNSSLKPLAASLVAGARADLNDLLTSVNLRNLHSTAYEQPYAYFDYPVPGKKKEWDPQRDQNNNPANDYIDDSGACDQRIISSIASGIDFGDTGDATPKEVSILPELDFKMKNAGKIDDEKAYRTFVLYGVGNIVQGAGNTIPATLVKKDFITTTITGEATPYQVPIDGGDAMFEQGSAKINTKNKIGIDKMLTAALAPLAGKPESIVITGGASYEPDGQGPINKKLVVNRAKAVKTYLETLYPELKGVITVNDKDFSKIQATDTPADYEKFRKVYLDIKGVLQGETYTVDKEIEYLVDGEIKCDSVEIIQYAISFEFDLPNDKA
jgi:hypothetical protein